MRISVWLKVLTPLLSEVAQDFQSAVRISVWLKNVQQSRRAIAVAFQSAVRISVWLKLGLFGESGGGKTFQSAVRISVWLKDRHTNRRGTLDSLSIRRADLCLVEGREKRCSPVTTRFQSAVRISVWLKSTIIYIIYRIAVFQSAVRISVWLKHAWSSRSVRERPAFNPPCGSLFG